MGRHRKQLPTREDGRFLYGGQWLTAAQVDQQRNRVATNSKLSKLRAYALIAEKTNGYLCCAVRACPVGGSEEHLVLDHINDDGAAHRRSVSSGLQTYLWILRDSERAKRTFQLLCDYHNRIKPQLRSEDFR